MEFSEDGCLERVAIGSIGIDRKAASGELPDVKDRDQALACINSIILNSQ